MNKETLVRLIDSVYELEGLLQLALRSETPVEGLKEATEKKLTDILEQLEKDGDEKEEDVTVVTDVELESVTGEESVTRAQSETKGGRSHVGVPVVLSVNDRFRYTRTMFNGNTSRLEAALTAIASLENEKDIRQFLAAESGLDAYGDPEIESFVELLDARLK